MPGGQLDAGPVCLGAHNIFQVGPLLWSPNFVALVAADGRCVCRRCSVRCFFHFVIYYNIVVLGAGIVVVVRLLLLLICPAKLDTWHGDQ